MSKFSFFFPSFFVSCPSPLPRHITPKLFYALIIAITSAAKAGLKIRWQAPQACMTCRGMTTSALSDANISKWKREKLCHLKNFLTIPSLTSKYSLRILMIIYLQSPTSPRNQRHSVLEHQFVSLLSIAFSCGRSCHVFAGSVT